MFSKKDEVANVDNVDGDETEKEKSSFGRNCCKKALKFSFSHIGLCGMVIAYTVAGGFIFEHLEKTNEKQECLEAQKRYEPAENETIHKLWDVGSSYRNLDEKELALVEFQKVVRLFREQALELGYNGTNCSMMGEPGGPGFQWSFPGALLFSVTVITTIGYGNIAPKTFWGRLVCIAYATLGIPLMLLCLANIGDVLADVFRFIYTKVCCCGCCRRKTKVEQMKDQHQNSKGRKTPEAWKAEYNRRKSGYPGPGAAGAGPVVVDDDDDDEDEEDERISVPLTITMGIIAGYISLGALLFAVWEKWSALKSSYFCFVTISTIGFGDVVPGSAEFEDAEDQWKMIGASVYMLFGMAILSMCFSLIQEEIVAKFKWLGEKLGLVEKKGKGKDGPEDEAIGGNTNNTPPPAGPMQRQRTSSMRPSFRNDQYNNDMGKTSGSAKALAPSKPPTVDINSTKQ